MTVIKDAVAVGLILTFALLLCLPKLIHGGIELARAMGAN